MESVPWLFGGMDFVSMSQVDCLVILVITFLIECVHSIGIDGVSIPISILVLLYPPLSPHPCSRSLLPPLSPLSPLSLSSPSLFLLFSLSSLLLLSLKSYTLLFPSFSFSILFYLALFLSLKIS